MELFFIEFETKQNTTKNKLQGVGKQAKEMLEGWYMRAKANEEMIANGKSSNHEDYKLKYKTMKKKLKFLLHENEFFRGSLKTSQKRLLKLSRDKTYLLDRLLKYEKPENFSDCSDSDDQTRKRKLDSTGLTKAGVPRRKRGPQKQEQTFTPTATAEPPNNLMMDRMFTPEEVAQHLSQKEFQGLDTEMFSRDVPAEMFSSDSNDSPPSNSNLEDEYVNLDRQLVHHNVDVPYNMEN